MVIVHKFGLPAGSIWNRLAVNASDLRNRVALKRVTDILPRSVQAKACGSENDASIYQFNSLLGICDRALQL
jgi:hypothetical protein